MRHRPDWLVSVSRHLRDISYLRKWVVLGALIGLISGLGASVFFWALDWASHLFLGIIVGFEPSTPLGEGGQPIGASAERWWLLPLVVGLGGLIAGWIVFRFAPEAEGHGTDAAIEAFHHGAKSIRARVPLVKTVASAITIGSGGSGGREGPTAQIGAGFGSFLSRLLDLDARDSRIAVASGMGAGVGAIFRAPLGGAVMAAEIPYRDGVESEALVPGFVASITAFAVFGSLVGFSPIFGEQLQATFDDPFQLVYYAIIGLAAGVIGRLYIYSFYWFQRRFGAWSMPRYLKPAIAGLMVGLIGLFLPGALGTGYGWVQATLSRESLLDIPLGVILLLPFAKILATSLSIGSGGSGGVFGPGMFIGGLLGAGLWRLLEPNAPDVPLEPTGFVIVAMVALFGSIAHAPLAVMLMVAEMTGNLSMLAPAMLAIGLATLVVGDRTMYVSQLRGRADSPGHRFRMALPLMASLPARDSARSPRLTLSPDEPVDQVIRQLSMMRLQGAPVVSSRGDLRGSADLAALQAITIDEGVGARPVAEALRLEPTSISAADSLDDALGLLVDAGRDWGPVEEDGKLIGVITTRDILASYRQALAGNVRRMSPVGTSKGTMVEADVAAGSPLVGLTVARAPLPRDTVLVSIERNDEVIVPRGDVTIKGGDRLTVFATAATRETLLALLADPRGDAAPGSSDEAGPGGADGGADEGADRSPPALATGTLAGLTGVAGPGDPEVPGGPAP
jgi:CIC family chloride channel protein